MRRRKEAPMEYLQAAHGQVVFIAGVSRQAEDGEGHGGRGQTRQGQLPLAGVRLLQQGGQLEHSDL